MKKPCKCQHFVSSNNCAQYIGTEKFFVIVASVIYFCHKFILAPYNFIIAHESCNYPKEIPEEVTDQGSNFEDIKENFIFLGVIPAGECFLEKSTRPSDSGADRHPPARILNSTFNCLFSFAAHKFKLLSHKYLI